MNVDVDFSLIMGLALGLEYVPADEEAGIDRTCVILDVLVFRVIFEFTGE